MAITPTGSGSCTTCSDTRTVSVSFTAPTPAPSGGYIVKWKKSADADSTYTQVTPNPTASPVSIPNVPACDDLTVSVQASCGGGTTSTASLTTITGVGYKLKCGCGFSGNYSGSGAYNYPNIPIDFTGVANGSQITLSYNPAVRYNTFTILNVTDSTDVVTSGSTINSGTLVFTYNSAKTYSLKVSAVADAPFDAWSVSLSCGSALSCALGTLTVAKFVPAPGQNGLLYAANRFVFSNTVGASCAAAPVEAYYLPDPNSIFGVLSIFQNAAGTIPFTNTLVRDLVYPGSWTAPTAIYSYNTSTGAVGAYQSSCL